MYEGAWRRDKFEGKGSYTLSSGARFDGSWRRGRIDDSKPCTVVDDAGQTYKNDEAAAKWFEICPRRCPTPAERFAAS